MGLAPQNGIVPILAIGAISLLLIIMGTVGLIVSIIEWLS